MTPVRLPPPSKLALAAELPRALGTLVDAAVNRSVLRAAPKGDGRPVLVLPGVATGDGSVRPMAHFLSKLGYRAETWQLGMNRGTPTIGAEAEHLIARVTALAERDGSSVTLIGVSLGGIMARLAAHRGPSLVREVVTICSPYAADARATNAWRTYQLLSGERVDDPAVAARLVEARRPLPVPATAIWSRNDGMVNPAACFVADEPGLRIVAVDGGHLLVHLRPSVWLFVAQLLAGEAPAALPG
ncbi:esterase/lipase family protein [Sphingomonas sp. GlSt437]|uniref:esterase/lipase family protein n=1 Tax=Sphingomonas sp. GlSt437 TaxID=3389970 RepID=UPI003A8C2078